MSLDCTIGIDAAIIKKCAVIVGVVGMIGFPETRVHFQGNTKCGKVNVVFLFLDFFPAGGTVEQFDTEFQASFGGFFLQYGEDVLEALIPGRQGERKSFAGVIYQDAVGSSLGEAGPGEGILSLFNVEGSGRQGRMREVAVAIRGRPHSLVIATEKLLNNEVPVGGVVDAYADILVIEFRARGIDP